MKDVFIPFLKNYWKLIIGTIISLIAFGSMIAFIIASDNDWFGVLFVIGAVVSGIVLFISILVLIVPFFRERRDKKKVNSI